MKIGISGIGKWGTKVTREYLALEEHEVFIFDEVKDRLDLFPDATPTSSFDDLIRQVDCVHICTPNWIHAKQGLAALDAGVHVLIEKPMSIHRESSFALAEVAQEQGLILQCGHIFRFANAIKLTRELMSGENTKWISFKWSQLMPPIKQTDIIYDLLPHPIDIAHFLTGEWPCEIQGFGRSVRRKDLFEIVSLNYRYPSEFFVNVSLSWLNGRRTREIEITLDEYTLVIDPVNQILTKYAQSEAEKIECHPNNTIRAEITHFLNCINTGANQLNSALVGIRNVEIIEETFKKLHARYSSKCNNWATY